MTTVPTIAAAAPIVAAAAAVQGCTGAGFGLVCAPLLLLLDPALVPGPVLMVSMVVTAAGAYRERAALAPRDLGWAAVASVPGTVVGLWALGVLAPRPTALIVAGTVAAAVIAAWCGLRIPATRTTLTAAGGLSGFLGTVVGTAGPPVSLVYRPTDTARLRATLSAYFTVTSLVAVVLLAGTGKLSASQLGSALSLLPAALAGLAASLPLAARLTHGTVANAVLAIAFASALTVGTQACL
ncbi:sulfite exporter TauE/SafE family protein [Yinghuangia soli]|uniref:Probable membrane transporter protein n=1 Tax=Yinghuangia soli TaxID=2908204 RepID=A0AA41PWC6_9ACTN|nr:sulfite exporter TauE/SafE family protein [Yinghuangia soli]MCF2527138.1 sulfite exporter TauE/SafE family protein [Yinghuangia soli]